MSETKKSWTDRTYAIYEAATAAAYGLRDDAPGRAPCPEPSEPTRDESLLLSAREAFKAGQQCRGWDLVDEAMS